MTEQPISPAEYDALQAELRAAHAEIERLTASVGAAEQSYRYLFESTGDSIFIIEPNTYAILDVNQHGLRRFGYKRDHLMGMTLDEVEIVDREQGADNVWMATFSGTRVYECHYRHKNGELIPVEVRSRLVQVGERSVIQHLVQKIADRKQMEAERDQLIADMDYIEQTVKYDLSNLLAIIQGYTLLLETDRGDLAPEQVAGALQSMAKATQNMSHQIDVLLFLISLRQSDQIDMQVLNMSDIIMNVQTHLAPLLAESAAVIRLPTDWPAAVGHMPWVKEIWLELMSTVFQLSDAPSIIELGGALVADGRVRFWVRDNGTWNLPENAVFEPIHIVPLRPGKAYKPYGLGLIVMRRIVEKLGGTVKLERAEGAANTFSFTLPAAPSNYF